MNVSLWTSLILQDTELILVKPTSENPTKLLRLVANCPASPIPWKLLGCWINLGHLSEVLQIAWTTLAAVSRNTFSMCLRDIGIHMEPIPPKGTTCGRVLKNQN